MATEKKDELATVDLADDEAPPRANPCEGLATFVQTVRNNAEVLERAKALTAKLSEAAGRARGLFAAPALGRDYSQVDVLDVSVADGAVAGTFTLKTRARFEGCSVDLTIGGGSLSRSPRDFEWLRGCLRDEYPGCVVPPISSDVYSNAPTAADALERFLAQCLAHPELGKAPELACLCSADSTELANARSAFAASREQSPLHVRWGAVVLDVVGNDTAVGQELIEDDPAALASAKRREADVRELYTWSRAQAYEIGRAEREATRGADALKQFEEAAGRTKAALASRFKQGKEARVGEVSKEEAGSSVSGPATSLAALHEMVGLAKALAEAVESRDRVRLQYVCARNALQLNKASRTARDRLGTMSDTTNESASALAKKAEEIDTRAPPSEVKPVTLAEAAAEVKLAADRNAPEDEVVQEEDYKQKALQLYGSLREKVVTYGSLGVEYVKERVPDQIPERQRVVALAQKGATLVASLGLRVASVAATGSARMQADEESVENAEKLVRDLADQFDAADARLRADALKLKATWDDLQLQAYDAFVRGESSRADTARAAADGAALSLVHLKHEASQDSTD